MYFKYVFITLLLQASIKLLNADFYHPECTQAGLTCLDCYTQKLCVNLIVSMVHWSNTTCLSDLTNNQYPYCDPTTEQCSSVRPEGCAEKNTFTCLRNNGVFPDLGNCSRYFVCENNTSSIISCESTHIYNQKFGKCILKLSNVDCKGISCGMTNHAAVYPGDSTLYYQCKSGVAKLQACTANMVYNASANTCESICKNTNPVAVPQNCSKYYTCSLVDGSYSSQLQTCAKDYGFNPNFNRCELGFSNLCNELSLLEIDILQLLQLLPNFVRDIILNIYTIIFKWNYVISLLKMFGVSEDIMSSSAVVIHYVVTYKTIPPTFVTYLSNLLLTSSSKELKTIIELILKLITKVSLPSGSGSLPAASTFQLEQETPQNLENILNNAMKIDFNDLVLFLENENQNEFLNDFISNILKYFNLTPSLISTIFQTLQYQVNFVVEYLNSVIGFNIFATDNNGNVRLNSEVLQNILMNNQDGLRTLRNINNPVLSQVFETIQLRNVNYDSLHQFADKFYFSFGSLANYISKIT